MIRDFIVDEVRAIRDEIAKKHDYDVGAIFETLRRLEKESGREHVSFPPRTIAQPSAAGDARSARP